MDLFDGLTLPDYLPIDGIDLRRCGVDELLSSLPDGCARLVMADPPWIYARDAGVANPEMNGIYEGLSEEDIARHLALTYRVAAKDARLAVWTTWPKLMEWVSVGLAGPQWRYVSGGAWLKERHVGVGYHWRGWSEPLLLFTKGAAGRPREMIGNGFASIPRAHSEKPVDWLRSMVRAWTSPGDLVVDLYAGLAPLARACFLEGRRYVGAEIDHDRHQKAMARLHRSSPMPEKPEPGQRQAT